MKSLKFFLIFCLSLVSTLVGAQSLQEINGLTWKDKQGAIDALGLAQNNEAILLSFESTPFGSVILKFREIVFNNARNAIEQDVETATAIFEGYNEAVKFMSEEPVFEQIDKIERKKYFDEVVTTLQL